jgi:hypothetical protein
MAELPAKIMYMSKHYDYKHDIPHRQCKKSLSLIAFWIAEELIA